MILFLEPISKNTSMYVPAYPLPIMEIASFVKFNIPDLDIGIISIPVDYGLPLTQEGKNKIYQELLAEISEIQPKAIGISCTAISQAEELISLCECIKERNPSVFIFVGGYFPTIYYEEIFSKTSAVDLIVTGEGEMPTLQILEHVKQGKNPINENIPNLAWKKDGQIIETKKGGRFDLKKKALLDLKLLRHPREYDILPYAFSRGCPYHCNFCMEEFIRPARKEVPAEIIHQDLLNLSIQSNTHTLMISDALFKSFYLFPFFRSLGMKVNFETRCDVLDPSILSGIADICGMLVLGFESASYNTLRRMNKVRDRAHHQQYITNTAQIFHEAVKNEIPIMVFMIAGYPGDTEKDLEESLRFVKGLSKNNGPGGHVFKIGECHVYPKTNIYNLALSLPNVVFDNDGVFGQNIVRQPSKGLTFETVLSYIGEIFQLSNTTPKMQKTFVNMMPFFRLPAHALQDDIIPDICYRDKERGIFNVQGASLSAFKQAVPDLGKKYKKLMSGQRSTRTLDI